MKSVKKILFGFMAVCLAAACEKQVQPTLEQDYFELNFYDVKSKTSFSPSDRSVAWDADDEITVLVNEGGIFTNYTFHKTPGNANGFYNKEFKPKEGSSYEYYAVYPVSDSWSGFRSEDGFSNATVIIGGGKSEAQFQSVSNSGEHIMSSMSGKAVATGTETPAIGMNHMTNIISVSVSNETQQQVNVSSVSVDISDEFFLIGDGYFDPEGNVKLNNQYGSRKAVLNVESGSIEPGFTGEFYLAVAPFILRKGYSLIVTVVTDKGNYTRYVTNDTDLTFGKGTVNRTELKITENSDYYIEYTSDEKIELEKYSSTYDETTKSGRIYFNSPSVPDSLLMKNELVSSVTIPSNIEYIGKMAFYGAKTKFSEIKFAMDGNLREIGDQAFSACKRLHSVDIPSSVMIIGSKSFYNIGSTTNKASIRIRCMNPPRCVADSFDSGSGAGRLNVIEVPAGTMEAYRLQWSAFGYFEKVTEFAE